MGPVAVLVRLVKLINNLFIIRQYIWWGVGVVYLCVASFWSLFFLIEEGL